MYSRPPVYVTQHFTHTGVLSSDLT